MNNYIKYLQAGGTAQANDTQNQVVALVEAAMSGDKKAAQQIEQIMQAAQQGDQQAQQIAGLIQQVAEQLQGGQVPQEEKGGSVPKAQIGTALYNIGRKVVNHFRDNNTEETAPSIPPTPAIPITTAVPRETRADRDFANRIKEAESTYSTVSYPEEGRSYEHGIISIPQNGGKYFRDIIHYNDGTPSDTIYSYSRPYYDAELNTSSHNGDIFTPNENQRRILDAKYDYTPTSNLYKCGGKVKKGEKGLPIPTKKVVKNAKGGCPCQLKKVGGKLVEVDSCNGKIVK